MLSERISTLFTLLGCNNTSIARFAGCSSGNISKLKTGNRAPKPASRSIASFVNGIYSYADYENMLPALQALCHSSDTTRDALLPALISWLYGTDEIVLPAHVATPNSKRIRMLQRQSFGERLDLAVTLLELSNSQLAALLNIDVSLVSRYRKGIYSPHGNIRLAETLSGVLLSRAERSGKTAELASLCGIDEKLLDAEAVSAWLYEAAPEEDSNAIARKLLQVLDEFTPVRIPSNTSWEVPKVPEDAFYYGTKGLRNAVIRLLDDAAGKGGELLLYSDEPMDWMTKDRSFFALWASLMAKCVNNGVRIRIIHNVDRVDTEMIDAIRGWLPLYISGMIEPFVFQKSRNVRFYHTVFLHSGGACIHGFVPAEGSESRWYEYITDAKRLDLLEREYSAMLSAASPILKVYNTSASDEYHTYCSERPGSRTFFLSELPLFTMQEELLNSILDRIQLEEPLRKYVLGHYSRIRNQFQELLRHDTVNLIFCPGEGTSERSRKINFSLELMNISIEYTEEEYAQHISAVMELIKNEKNFHLTLLPEPPLGGIQIAMPGDAVSVTRLGEPYAAFVFLNPALTKSVSDYLSLLIGNYATERYRSLETLDRLRNVPHLI